MAQQTRSTADQVRDVVADLGDLIEKLDIPSFTSSRVERLHERIEQAAIDLRAIARGR